MSELQKILDQREITPRTLSRLSGVHLKTLEKYLGQDGPYYTQGRLKVYWKLAKALDVDVEQLLLGGLWRPGDDVVRADITLSDAIATAADKQGVAICAINNTLRGILDIHDYQTISQYCHYRWTPDICVALQIATCLNCTIDALWGEYFKESLK